MDDSDQGMQDQRKSTGMEDSTAVTIEFLRARLLSERSVSRTAKQRSDELSKRVAELEEQLKIVSLQRKKAEKATADVLAILESQEMCELSEDYESSSDQETPRESAEGANSVKEDESSINSKVRLNESEDFSGSEHDSSRVSSGRLSWKGRKGMSRSIERSKASSMQRQTSLTSTSSSSRRHMGKSCRQIRHRESRSVAEESKNGSTKVEAQENGVATSSKGFLNLPNGGSDSLRSTSQVQEENVSENLDNQRNITNGSPDHNGYGRGKDMERALEHQAQLIGQYEEMEKAQREWEEKFRENNNSTPDSCDPGNYSDITEEREEIKAQQAQAHAGTVTTQISQAQELKSKTEDVCFSTEMTKTPPNGFQQPLDTDSRYLQHQKEGSNIAYTSQSREFELHMEKGRQSQENPENYNNPPSHGSDHHARNLGSQSADKSNSSHEAEASGSQIEIQALVPHQTTEGLGGVLEALKHARLSLQQKMNNTGLPIADGALVRAKPTVPSAKTMDRGEIPVGCAGLFRLPTDFPVEAHAQAKALGSGSQLSLPNYYPDREISTGVANPYKLQNYYPDRGINTGGERFLTNPYTDTIRPSYMDSNRPDYVDTSRPSYMDTSRPSFMDSSRPSYMDSSRPSYMDATRPSYMDSARPSYMDTRPVISADDRFLSRGYMDMGSGFPTQTLNPYVDPRLDTGLPSNSRFAYSPYPDRIVQMPATDGLSRQVSSSRTFGMPPEDHLSPYDDRIRPPSLYRR